MLTRSDGGRQSRWTASDDENICCSLHEINTRDRAGARPYFYLLLIRVIKDLAWARSPGNFIADIHFEQAEAA